MRELNPENYGELLIAVKQRIRAAQYEALKAVNKELITLYWDIGRLIVTRQQGKSWGKSVVEQLARDLQAEFSGKGMGNGEWGRWGPHLPHSLFPIPYSQSTYVV